MLRNLLACLLLTYTLVEAEESGRVVRVCRWQLHSLVPRIPIARAVRAVPRAPKVGITSQRPAVSIRVKAVRRGHFIGVRLMLWMRVAVVRRRHGRRVCWR